MLDFRNMDFGMKGLADSYTRKYGEGSCQHSFVSSWCLRKKYGDMFCERDGFLYTLRSNLCRDGERVYLFPHGDRTNLEAVKNAIQNVIDDAHENHSRVKFQTLTESAKDITETLFPGKFRAEYSRDLSEYVYSAESLLTLSGRHLKNKRNSVNSFCREFEGRFTVSKIAPEHIEAIRNFQGEWLEEKLLTENDSVPAHQLRQEDEGVQCALDDFFGLGLSGIVIFIDGELRGYMYGIPLNDECFDFISGKGSPSVPNISAVIKLELVKLCCEGYKLVNFEEDVGVQGLREMKTEYMPKYLIEKYIVGEI